MSYVSLYRKYRSQSFGEVIGQNHVTTVLQNAIRSGRIAHAYLFCGPRGCGKTSTARLLAKALTCQSFDGPTPEPCGTCSMCTRVRDGVAMDVIEMDAASETGIDDVREKIIENAKFSPAEARYKVYIIDEVHDLSLKAFDSLLKTIEEPPAHVVFILATTEAHKVPITVRSRCQRLDFRRGTMEDLTAVLHRVLDAESVKYQSEAVLAVAKAADGSFRDSLSLLEQVLAFTDGELTAGAVHDAVGTIGQEMLDSITSTLVADDLLRAFVKAGELVESGKDVKQVLIALQGHLRDLLVASVARSPQALPDASPARFAHLKEQSKSFTAPQLLSMIDVLAEAERDVRFTNQHRLLLERALWSILPASLGASTGSTQLAPPTSRPVPAPARSVTAPGQRPEPAPAAGNDLPDEAERTPTSDAVTTVPMEPARTIELDELRRAWPRVVKRVLQVSSSAAAYVDGVTVTALHGTTVVLGFPDETKRSFVEKPKRLEVVKKALADELGVSGLSIRCELAAPGGPAAPVEEPSTILDFEAPKEAPARAVDSPASNGADPDHGIRPAVSEEPGILSIVESEFGDRLLDV